MRFPMPWQLGNLTQSDLLEDDRRPYQIAILPLLAYVQIAWMNPFL